MRDMWEKCCCCDNQQHAMPSMYKNENVYVQSINKARPSIVTCNGFCCFWKCHQISKENGKWCCCHLWWESLWPQNAMGSCLTNHHCSFTENEIHLLQSSGTDYYLSKACVEWTFGHWNFRNCWGWSLHSMLNLFQ